MPAQPLKLFRNIAATHLPNFVERSAAANPFAIVNAHGAGTYIHPTLADLNGPSLVPLHYTQFVAASHRNGERNVLWRGATMFACLQDAGLQKRTNAVTTHHLGALAPAIRCSCFVRRR